MLHARGGGGGDHESLRFRLVEQLIPDGESLYMGSSWQSQIASKKERRDDHTAPLNAAFPILLGLALGPPVYQTLGLLKLVYTCSLRGGRRSPA